MSLFYYCNFALGECKLYKGITNYAYNKYWGVQIPGSTYYMLHRYYITLHMAVARSSSGDVAIRYILQVLWVASRFPIRGPTAARRYGSSLTAICARPNTPAAWYCPRKRGGAKTKRAVGATGAGTEYAMQHCLYMYGLQ